MGPTKSGVLGLGRGPVIAGAVAAGGILVYALVRLAGPRSNAEPVCDDVDFVAADVAHMARMRENVRSRLHAVAEEEATLRGLLADHPRTDSELMRWRGLSEECTRMLLELDGATVHHPDARLTRKQLIADVLKVADALKLE